MSNNQEIRERQLAELMLISDMYPSEFIWRSPIEEREGGASSNLEIAVVLDSSYTIEISLPLDYPTLSKPQVYLACGELVNTATRKRAREGLSQTVEKVEVGIECIDLVINEFMEFIATIQQSSTEATPVSPGHRAQDSDSSIKRAVVWSHHLLATSKRRSIVSWSKELRLDGFSRPGYPGAIFVEGEAADVDEFIRRLKELRWQALQVREVQYADNRVCGSGNGIVEVESLGEIGEALKHKGRACVEMFFQGMRITTTE